MNGYIRKWLDIPISGTLSNVFLERDKCGLNVCPPSIKFTQCQTVLRNSLKESPNDSLKDLWKSSSCHTNIQYDVYKSTKEVLEDFRSNQEDKLQHHLTSQGFFFSNVIKYSLSSVNSIWSEVQSHLPKNIYNFTIRYINNSLPTLTRDQALFFSFFFFCFFASLARERHKGLIGRGHDLRPSLHVRIWQDGDYHKVLIAPFVLILNHSFMLSLVVNSALIALPGDTTQSLTSLPSHFNL